MSTFVTYFDYSIVLKLLFCLEGEPLEEREDMLAQLDQLNAYMMILRGLATDSKEWKERMLGLALALKSSFWNEKYNIMWGNANYKVLDSVRVLL